MAEVGICQDKLLAKESSSTVYQYTCLGWGAGVVILSMKSFKSHGTTLVHEYVNLAHYNSSLHPN